MTSNDAISLDAVIEWLKEKDFIKMSWQEENARKELQEYFSVTPKPTESEDIKKERYNNGFYDGYRMATKQANAVIDDIKAELQTLRGCSCYCSDGIIDDVEDIIDKHTMITNPQE